MNKIAIFVMGLALAFGFSLAAFAQVAPTGSISGTKWNDIDGDTAMDAGEPGIPATLIYLDLNTNGVLDGGDVSALTDVGGNYTFTGLANGTYIVRENVPVGFTQTFPTAASGFQHIITISGGVASGPANFGNRLIVANTGIISGTKFNDTDGDGVRDTSEPGIGGVTFFLDANNNNSLDSGELSTTTDANGNFTFSGLAAGSFTVREVTQTGFTQTTPGAGADFESAVTVTPGGTVTGLLFGNRLTVGTGSISGTKFNDLDGDGVRDPAEPAVAGVTVFLDANGNNTLDAGETSTATDTNGNFSFSNLANGSFTVREVVPAGWTQVFPGSGAGFEHSLTLGVGGSLTGVMFANRLGVAAGGSITGVKFNDLDGDGVREAGEPGLAGIVIFLDADNDGIRDAGELSTTTDANGSYSFAGLAAGSYVVREEAQAGWTQTFPTLSDSFRHAINLALNGSAQGFNFGNFRLGSVGGVGGNDDPGDVLGDAVGGPLPVTGVTLPMLAMMLLAFAGLGYHSIFAKKLAEKAAKK